MKTIITSGKRKSAVAKAVIKEGNGKIILNNQDYKTLQLFDKLRLEEPIRIAEQVLGKINFDVTLSARGGGARGQVEAATVALSKAIVKFSNSNELAKTLTAYDRSLLVSDVRRKEARKPGAGKARAKRQKSYR